MNLLHRNAALLAVVFLVLHVVSLLLDPYAQLRLIDTVVPFTNTLSTVLLAFGFHAVALLVLRVASSAAILLRVCPPMRVKHRKAAPPPPIRRFARST